MIDVSFESINYRFHVCVRTPIRPYFSWFWIRSEDVSMDGAYHEMMDYELKRDLGNWYQGLWHGFAITKCRVWRSPLPEPTRWNRYSLNSIDVEIAFYRNASPDQLHLLRREIEELEQRMTF